VARPRPRSKIQSKGLGEWLKCACLASSGFKSQYCIKRGLIHVPPNHPKPAQLPVHTRDAEVLQGTCHKTSKDGDRLCALPTGSKGGTSLHKNVTGMPQGKPVFCLLQGCPELGTALCPCDKVERTPPRDGQVDGGRGRGVGTRERRAFSQEPCVPVDVKRPGPCPQVGSGRSWELRPGAPAS
jgi:hypothetical protein